MTEKYLEELIRKYAEGEAGAEEKQRLLNWYRSASVGDVPWPSGDPAEKQKVYSRMLHRLQSEVDDRKVRRFRLSWLQIAAMLLLVCGAVYLAVYLWKPLSKQYITLSNPSGKIQMVRLPDGSSVWLNASSTIRYVKAFHKDRELELKGEAYFEVTPDKEHPFSVEAGEVRTTVLGTSFNIKAYEPDDATTVSVISGKVKVANDNKDLGLLTPSVQLQFDRHHQTAKTLTIDTASVLAWKKGRLQFDGQTMAEITATLERWYGVRFEFANPVMRSCRYYMNFDNTLPLEKLLAALSGITEMKYVFDKARNTIILSGGECR